MHELMFMVGTVVVVALATVLIGLELLGAWVIDRREQRAASAIRDASLVAQAQAEFLPTPSYLRHLEIEATKRGNLLAAAELSELAEQAHIVAGQGDGP